jgi:hypothetical protein
MKCLECQALNLRKVTRQQAAHEHGYCDALERYSMFLRSERACDKFSQAPEEGVAKRVAWLQQIKRK